MAPRANPPPKKNRARFGVKYGLRIYRGDLPPDTEYLDDDLDDPYTISTLVADVDREEGTEFHLVAHLQASLAAPTVFIPTPCALQKVENYDKLYPAKWKDPISYLHSTQTVEEACANALFHHDYTYLMDEFDKQWLDKNNQEARGEGTSASAVRASRKTKDKEADTCGPVSITEDELELVMGLMEKIVDQKVLRGDAPDFDFFSSFFLEPLPPSTFASFSVPAWVPQPAQLVRIARTVYPHWKHRRSLLAGARIQPALNFDESDFPNESYICFRRRDNKPVRKTRGGLVVNHADKLVNLNRNLSHALELAKALLSRETLKQSAATESQNVWNVRQPMADFLRQFPGMLTKADEERLLEKPKKIRPAKSSVLPKVKVLPPTQSGSPAQQAAAAQAIRPSERSAEIQQDVARRMQQEAEILKRRACVDLTDDPYLPGYVPRADKMWVDVAPKTARARESRPLRVRVGRGGRRFVDRRSSSDPYILPLRSHRTHVDDDDSSDFDEEATRRLRSQWRFDSDTAWTGPPQEEGRELVDEFDPGYLVQRLKWAVEGSGEPLRVSEVTLVGDATLVVQNSEGRSRKALPFLTNAIHLASVQGYPDVHSYLVANGIATSHQPPQQRPRQPSAQAQQNIAPAPAPVVAAPRPRALRDASLPLPLPNGTSTPNPTAPAQDIAIKPSPPSGNTSAQNQNHMPPSLVSTQTTNGRAIYVPSLAAANANFKIPALQRGSSLAAPSPTPVRAVVGDSK
ncbi:hypothetical protein C8F01DRAFT_1149307 [Mycena amicta]|nr:hypothetical protein C8F01DRAFT_1149307 [Mycena amicta]